MIRQTANKPIPRAGFGRFFGMLAASLIATTIAATAAISVGDQEIAAKLTGGATLTTATVDQIHDAALAAIANPVNPAHLPSTIVLAAVKRTPQFAPEYSEAGVLKVYGLNPPPSLGSAAAKDSQAYSVVSYAMKYGLAEYMANTLPNGNKFRGPEDTGDAAASIMARTMEGFNVFDRPTTNCLREIVKAAVRTGLNVGQRKQNAAAGAIGGAIAVTAGVNNSDLKVDGGALGANNNVIKSILQTAARFAPTRVTVIAQAAGYAFATAYLSSHRLNGAIITAGPDAAITFEAFVAANRDEILRQLKIGLSEADQRKYLSKVKVNIYSGIYDAYNNLKGAGSKGYVFSNGQGSAVTDIQGL